MTINVLFIDEDPRSLSDFRRLTEPMRGTITAEFAAGWAEGREAMARSAFEVVVAGGPGTDRSAPAGLRGLRELHPDVRRLYVTSDREAVGPEVAEQYLWRPFDGDRLRVAILATRHLGNRVGSARLAELARGGVRLPSLPDVYVRMQEEIRSDDPSMERIAGLVAADPALSLKVLQIVNSALYGLRNEVGDIAQATNLLGMNTVSSLVLAAGVFRNAERLGRRLVERLWRESIQVAALARGIAVEAGFARSLVESTQLAGLLHDLGDIVLYQNWPEEFLEVDLGDRLGDERRRFGATHADLGGYVAATWGLPSAVVGAVANHHEPAFERATAPGPTEAVHVARELVSAGLDPSRADLDHRHLHAIGWAGSMDHFAGLGAA